MTFLEILEFLRRDGGHDRFRLSSVQGVVGHKEFVHCQPRRFVIIVFALAVQEHAICKAEHGLPQPRLKTMIGTFGRHTMRPMDHLFPSEPGKDRAQHVGEDVEITLVDYDIVLSPQSGKNLLALKIQFMPPQSYEMEGLPDRRERDFFGHYVEEVAVEILAEAKEIVEQFAMGHQLENTHPVMG